MLKSLAVRAFPGPLGDIIGDIYYEIVVGDWGIHMLIT